MPRIPMPSRGNVAQLGNRGPDRIGAAQFDTRGMTAGLEGVRDIAAGAQRLAAGIQQHQQHEADEADALARARAANEALDYELAIKAKTADLEARRLDGSIALDDYEDTARAELEEIQKPIGKGLQPADAERFHGGLRNTRETALAGVGVAVRTARREELKGQIGLLTDNLGKFASDPNADLGAIIERHAALAPAYQKAGVGDFAKQHQAFADRLYYDNAKARLNVVRGSLEGLAQLERDITGGSAAPMPPPAGLLEPGNIDLHNRPRVKNADGSISTVRSISINVDGREVLIPTVSDDGRILSDKDAVKQYRETGRHLGKFETVDAANAYAQQLHESQTQEYTGGRYAGKLDADKQNALLSQISTYRSQLEAKQDREGDRIEARADRALQTLEKYAAENIEPPLDVLDKLKADVAPSSRAGEWNDTVTAMREAREIAKLPPDAQLRYVEEQEAKLGGRLTLAQKRNIETTRANYQQRVKDLREDPLGYDAKVQGYTVPPLDLQSMLTGDPAALQAQIAGRMDLVASARKRYGSAAGTSPLRPQEAKAMAEAIDQSPPQQVVKMLGNLRQVFGDDQAYLAVMGQIAKDSPVRAHAGALALVNPKGADLIVRGEALLKGEGGKAFPMPPPSQFDRAVADAVGDAFADGGEAYANALRVVRAGYAAGSESVGDVSGDIDGERVENVIKATLGTPVEFGGQKVLAPVGWDEDRFQSALETAWKAAPRPEHSGEPDDYRLVQYGDKAFRFMRGRKFLVGTDGRPLTVTLR